MVVNRHKIRIEWGDCDPAGIVYYPRYFEYFDACTAALFESAGLPKRALFETYGIAGIPMVDTRANFIAPSTFGDDLVVESTITGFGKSSFTVHHKLFKGETLAAEGFEKRVWTVRPPDDPQRIRAQAIPREVIDKLSA
jgi:4-hydroxybenzoyl-CoA thioesterase